MIVSKNKLLTDLVIDLTGPQGNVSYLLSQVEPLGKMINLNQTEIEDIQRSITSGDDEYAVKVLDDNFGSFLTLLR